MTDILIALSLVLAWVVIILNNIEIDKLKRKIK